MIRGQSRPHRGNLVQTETLGPVLDLAERPGIRNSTPLDNDKESIVFAALFSLLLPLSHAQTFAQLEGTYQCAMDGEQHQVSFVEQNNHLFLEGLDIGLNEDGLGCTNQNLKRQENGAIYTYFTECDANNIYRTLTLDRPASQEHFSTATHIEQINQNSVQIRVKIHFTGTSDRDVIVNCSK